MTNTAMTTAASAAIAGMEDMSDLTQLVSNAAADRPEQIGVLPFLKMEKDGTWVYGQENIEVEPGSQWAVNPKSFVRGYVCWTDYPESMKRKNDRMGEFMVPLSAKRPVKEELPEYLDPDGLNGGQPWPWTDAMGVQLVCISGEDEGVVVQYNTNSISGLRILNNYFDELIKKAAAGTPIAIVTMGKDSYQHKKYGKTVIPVLDVIEWRAVSDTSAPKAVEQKAETGRRRRPAIDDKPTIQPEPERTAAEPETASGQAPEPNTASEQAPEPNTASGQAPAPTRRRRRPAA